MRILFWGTPDFAVPSLRALQEEGHAVVAVVTQPDRPAGRGRKIRPSPVKIEAEREGIPVLQPEKLSLCYNIFIIVQCFVNVVYNSVGAGKERSIEEANYTMMRHPSGILEAKTMDRILPGAVAGSHRLVCVFAVTIILVVGVCDCPLAGSGKLTGPRVPPDVRLLRDLQYVTEGHERNRLDLYLPEQAEASEPLPLIVWVHGGAWLAGSKERCPALRFLRKGYAVASINYRLRQHAIFPAQIEDCKAALRWLRANAKKYRLDPKRIGVWGSSAGGHLVALLGTTGDVKEFDKGQNLEVSSRVQAVCDFFGPTDFTKMSLFPSEMDHDAADSPESQLIGGPVQQNREACRRANPITYVTKDDPPFLIMHGDRDMTVPHNQSELLYEALKAAGVKVKFHTVKGAGHGFGGPKIDKFVDGFFDKNLKR